MYIPNVEADPRRKLPGGQSSPQSLRGIASILSDYGKERVGRRQSSLTAIFAALCILRHRSQWGAEAMAVPYLTGLSQFAAHSLCISRSGLITIICYILGTLQRTPLRLIHAQRRALQHTLRHSSSVSLNPSSTQSLLSLRLGISLVELDAHRVHAVPLVRRRWVSLALENMS